MAAGSATKNLQVINLEPMGLRRVSLRRLQVADATSLFRNTCK